MQMRNIINKIISIDFRSFLIKTFYTLNPSLQFIDNWHLALIVEYLKTIEAGEIKRLIINMPPRSLKSVTISVAWVAWLLAKNPSLKIIIASYSRAISIKHLQDVRSIMQSDWYRFIFPNTKIVAGQNTQKKFVTSMHGFYMASSIGSILTGEGADYIIIDDPHTPIQAMSSSLRQKAITWYEGTLSTRLNNRKTGVILLVMQRLHTEDLSGYLIQNPQFKLLKIPFQATEEEHIQYGNFSHFRGSNEILYKHYTELDVTNMKQELGVYGFHAQYQQQPEDVSGSLLQEAWLKYYTHVPENAHIFQSWDCASKGAMNNDYSVCTTWATHEGSYYLLDVHRKKMNFVSLKKAVLDLYENFRPKAILIEDCSAGQQLIQEFEKNFMPIKAIIPKQDKIARLLSAILLFELGKILLPSSAPWLSDYKQELLSFPRCKNDDQVDSSTQFLNWFKVFKAAQHSLRILR